MNGGKRHILVDIMGLVIGVIVAAASVGTPSASCSHAG
jgi:hypothetical protein